MENQVNEASWCRDDVPSRQVPTETDEDKGPGVGLVVKVV